MIELVMYKDLEDDGKCNLCPFNDGCESYPPVKHPPCWGGYYRDIPDESEKENEFDTSGIIFVEYEHIADEEECDLCPYLQDCNGSSAGINKYGCQGGYFREVLMKLKFYEWDEPWHGLTKNGNALTFCNVRCRMSEQDIVNHMRLWLKENGFDTSKMTDQDLLEEFVTVYWAWEAK